MDNDSRDKKFTFSIISAVIFFITASVVGFLFFETDIFFRKFFPSTFLFSFLWIIIWSPTEK